MTIVPFDIKADLVTKENVTSLKIVIMKAPSLIPFVVGLIGFESCLNGSSEIWKYGPEYTFHVGVNASAIVPGKTNILCSNVTITLKCRPFSSNSDETTDGLQCYVKKAQITNYDVIKLEKSEQKHDNNMTSKFEIGDSKFEIIYDKNGIIELKFAPISPWRLNMLRAIANQLNIGFDRFDKGGERFAVVEVVGYENSTIGECETKFEMSKQMTDRVNHWNSTECENKIHIQTYAYGNKNPMIAIDKIRDTKKCLKSTPYVFGADEVEKDELPFINITMTSSLTSFFVGPHSFQSQTKNCASESLKTNNGTILRGTSEETINLILESIDPAQSEFKRIVKPGLTTIFADAPRTVSQ